MNNEEVQHKLDNILNALKSGKITSQEAHEAMKPLNDLIYKAIKKINETSSLRKLNDQ